MQCSERQLRDYALCSIGGLLLSLSGRDFVGSGYAAVLAFLPILHVCLNTQRGLQTGASTFIAGFGAAVVGGEGLLPISPLWFAGLVLLQSLWYFLPGLFFFWVREHTGPGTALWSFPLIWVGVEWLMNARLLWGQWTSLISIAYTQANTLLLETASWSSTSAVTAFLLYSSVSLYCICRFVFSNFYHLRSSSFWPRENWGQAMAGLIGGGGLLLVLVGTPLTQTNARPEEKASTHPVTIVQGATTMVETLVAKYNRTLQHRLLRKYERLTEQAPSDSSLVVWPESSVPMVIQKGNLYPELEEALHSTDSGLLGGLVRTRGGLYNSALTWNGKWYEVAYHKRGLVPVMESDLKPGANTKPVRVDSLPIGVAICMESTYPSLVRPLVQNGASVLAVLTNDTAFGNTNMPRWHLQTSMFRAVETGRYVIHASQSGPSGLIAPDGTLLNRSSRDTSAVVSGHIRPRRHDTLYVAWGDWLGGIGVGLCLLVLPLRARHRLVNV